jgi:hypothetical protein
VLVVPISKDVILTKDGNKLRVVEYTNYKEGGPAVYAKSASKELVLVYFFDIAEINGTKVEYERGSKVFNALGKISREQHLPQPDDKIVVLKDSMSDEDEKSRAEVATLKLKSKSLGVNKGLFVKDDQGNAYRLKQILDIDRALGGSNFDRDAFMSTYKDYTGV